MKIKGINPVERHIEKVVLALFAMFVLAMLLMQTGLLGGSRGVRVGNDERPIDRALEGVREVALSRQTRLQSPQVAAGIPESLPNPAEVFDKAMLGSAASVQPLKIAGRPGLRLGDDGAAVELPGLVRTGDAKFMPVRVPASSKPIAMVHEGTIDPIEVAAIGSRLGSLLPPAQPFDVRAVSIESTFSADELRRLIDAAPEPGFVAIPSAVWQGRLELVDVQWFRQELGGDGTWGGETLLPELPGRPSLREIIGKGDFQPADFRTILDRERTERPDLRRPPFYRTIAGRQWVWPSQATKEATSGAGDGIAAKQRELAAVRQLIEETRRRLERTGQPPQQPPRQPGSPPPPPPGGGGGGRGPNADATHHGGAGETEDFSSIPPHWLAQSTGGGGGGGRGGGRGPDGSSTDRARREREEQAKKRLEDQIAKLTQRERELTAELAKAGVGAQAAPPAHFEEPLASLASTEARTITLWSHDLTAQPGRTYRYRAVVRVTNPLYNSDRLHEEQRSLGEAPVLSAEASEWSDAIAVSPNQVYFITSASDAGGPLASSARAAAEVFEFFYGFWRKATVSMTPGDALMGQYELPELATFTIEREDSAQGNFAVKERIPVERRRTVVTDIVLLDTAPIISGAAGAAQAYLRSGPGRIVSRRPAGEGAESALRAAYNESAVLGATAIIREPGGGPGPSGGGPPVPPPPGGQGPGGDNPDRQPNDPNDPPPRE